MNADDNAQFIKGKALMEKSDCKSCHLIDKKSIGPMYMDVAKKYKDDAKAAERIAARMERLRALEQSVPDYAQPQSDQTHSPKEPDPPTPPT